MTSVGEGKRKGYIYAIVSSILFGTKAVLVKIAMETGLTPIDIVFFRFLFATFVLGIYILIRHTNLHLNKGQFWQLVFLAIVGYAMMNLTYYGAFHRMSVSLTGMLHYIYPAAALVIARMVFHDNITKKQCIAVILAIGGAMLLSLGDISQIDPWGLVLALLSGIFYGTYAVGLGRPALKELDGIAIVFYLCLFSTVFLGIFEGIRGLNPFAIISLEGLVLMLVVAIFCTAFSMMMFRQAIVAIGSVSTTILSTLEPITVVILSLILFDESFNIVMTLGALLILIAVGLTVERQKQEKSRVKNDETL